MINAIKKMWDILILIKEWFIPEKMLHAAYFGGDDEKQTGKFIINYKETSKEYPLKDYHVACINITIPKKYWHGKMIIFLTFKMLQYFLHFILYFIVVGLIMVIFAALFVVIWDDVMPATFNLPATNIETIFEIALLFVMPVGLYECLKRFFKI